MERNTLYYGDCLHVMQQWPENTVDIIAAVEDGDKRIPASAVLLG